MGWVYSGYGTVLWSNLFSGPRSHMHAAGILRVQVLPKSMGRENHHWTMYATMTSTECLFQRTTSVAALQVKRFFLIGSAFHNFRPHAAISSVLDGVLRQRIDTKLGASTTMLNFSLILVSSRDHVCLSEKTTRGSQINSRLTPPQMPTSMILDSSEVELSACRTGPGS